MLAGSSSYVESAKVEPDDIDVICAGELTERGCAAGRPEDRAEDGVTGELGELGELAGGAAET